MSSGKNHRLLVGLPAEHGTASYNNDLIEDGHTQTFQSVIRVPHKNELKKKNVTGVLNFVKDKLIHLTDLTIKEEHGSTTLFKGGRAIVSVKEGLPIRYGIFIMLAQYLVFALLHGTGHDMQTELTTMFRFFEGSDVEMKRLLETYVESMDCWSKIVRDGHHMKEVHTELKTLMTIFNINNDDKTISSVQLFLDKNKDVLDESFMRCRMSKGYLQVYVRDRPGVNLTPYPLSYETHEYTNQSKSDPRVTVLFNGTKSGTYSGVFDRTDVNNTNVAKSLAKDMSQLQDGNDVVLFGFGYSGSGKTYTLMGNDNVPGALALALASFAGGAIKDVTKLSKIELDQIFIESTLVTLGFSASKANDHVKGAKKVIYINTTMQRPTKPEPDPQTGKKTKVPSEAETNLYYINDLTTSSLQASDVNLKRRNKIGITDQFVDLKNTGDLVANTRVNTFIRSIASATEKYLISRFRIRPTPNNATSSRVHTYYKFKLTFQNIESTLTVIDMAGRESPQAILSEFGLINMASTLKSLNNMMIPKWGDKVREVILNFRPDAINNKNNLPNLVRDVADDMGLIALDPGQAYDNSIKTKYEKLVKTEVLKKLPDENFQTNNPFTGYNGEGENNFARFQVYKNNGIDSNDLKRLYGLNEPIYYSNYHVAATIYEGFYIGASLDSLLKYFKDRKNSEIYEPAYVVEPNKLGVRRITSITQQNLHDLDVNNAKFIMLAHVRTDRPEGLKTTLEFAKELSATMPEY